ncbi:MAG: hypothetical protein AAB433_22095 [Nitrospirota bacterium]
MRTQKRTKLIHEGRYLAEVDVELVITEDEWSPYLSVSDAYKLDDVRATLKQGDTATAARYGRFFRSRRLPCDSHIEGNKMTISPAARLRES